MLRLDAQRTTMKHGRVRDSFHEAHGWSLLALPVATRRLSPLWKQLVMLGRGVRACSRFDRLTHHAHGHGGYIAAGGDVGSPFGGRAQADGRCRAWVLVHTCVPHLFRG